MFDFTKERVEKSIRESLTRLCVDYIDLVQVHDMEFAPSLDIIINETLPALKEVMEFPNVIFLKEKKLLFKRRHLIFLTSG